MSGAANDREVREAARDAVILLASASPRRKRLLESIGFEVVVVPPAIDDAAAPIAERDLRRLAGALAWFKAAQVLRNPEAATARARARWLVAADTICDVDGVALGKPRDEREAAAMIDAFRERRHAVHTGVCLVDLRRDDRRLFTDTAFIELGALDAARRDRHLRSGAWRGRAGGYNLEEVVDAGWPITCEGDPATVMGLPLRRLEPLLRSDRRNGDPTSRRAA